MNRTTDSRRAVGWVLFLGGAIVLLRLTAAGELAAPPLTSIDALTRWYDTLGAPTTAIALIRFAAEIAAWYLLGLTMLYGTATILRSGGIDALADALAVPGARRMVRGGLGIGLLFTTAAGVAAAEDEAASTATMQPEPPAADRSGSAWMTPGAPEPAPTTPPVSPVDDPESAPQTPPDVSLPTTWRVTEGESFWSIAEDLLVDALGHEPSDAEVVPYWRSLVASNRDRLVDRDDPDTIHPGQVLEIPRVPVSR